MDAKQQRIEREYLDAHTKACELVETIYDHLQDLPAPACGHPINWGHVGDLQRVNYLLREIVTFLDRSQRGD